MQKASRRRKRNGRLAVVLALVAGTPTGALAHEATETLPAAQSAPAADPVVDAFSRDLAVTARPAPEGYQLFTGRAAEGWAWRPLATIQPGSNDAQAWIGYHCLTGDGQYVVAVVAPRHFVNRPELRDRGGRAYVVKVATGTVRPLVAGVAVKYHSPGCGTGDTAVLSRNPGRDQARTELLVVDARSARVTRRVSVRGQVTGAVPSGSRVLATSGNSVVDVARPDVARASFSGQPFMLRAARGGFDVLVMGEGRRVDLWRSLGGAAVRAASGRAGRMRLFAGRGGRNIVVGAAQRLRTGGVTFARSPGAQPEAASLDGSAVLAPPPRPPGDHGRAKASVTHGDGLPAAGVRVHSGRSGRLLMAEAPDGSRRPYRREPPLVAPNGNRRGPVVARAAANTTTPKCAVPRNHLRRQVPQPSAAQIDWAIQQGTRNLLKGSVLTRPSNFANMGLASYQPSLDFARGELRNGAGLPVPPSVIAGVFAQENNWLQASRRSLPGLSGNPAIGDYYGSGGTLDVIDYDKADCGYGVAQITDWMSHSSTYLSGNGKAKIAVDYAENVAAGITFLVNKWNQLYDAGVTLNDAHPGSLENWYFAIWAYNSGFNPNTGTGPWGLGWTNNPQNADYPPDRQGFLRATYADAAHPGDWPYQERVFGWMETPQLDYKGRQSYAKPLNDQSVEIRLTIPGYGTFCTAANDCSPSFRWPGDPSRDYCTRSDRKCWWHTPVSYVSCPVNCAHSQFTVDVGATEPAAHANYPPACSSTLPSDSIIVDNQPAGNLNVEGCGSSNWTSQGTFTVAHGKDAAGTPLGEIDWHQLGTGFGGHIWFTKNQPASDTAHTNVGTWTPPPLSGVYNVRVHVPPNGASTSYARYRVHRGDGTVSERAVDQHLHENRWVSLGNYTLQAGAKVVLDNNTIEGDEKTNVAFDAVAFTPVSGLRVVRRIDAVSTFDSNQNLDTNMPTPGFSITPFENMASIYEWANRLSGDVVAKLPCVSTPTAACVGTSTHAAFTRWYSRVQAAGRERRAVEGPDTQPKWLSLSSPDPPEPLTESFLADGGNYKIRSRMTVEYMQTGGTIDPTSVTVSFENRTGDTHLPPFGLEIMRAIRDDYGVALPDLRYTAKDLNEYTHSSTSVDPMGDGRLPGRAYHYYSTPPRLQAGSCVVAEGISGGSIGYAPFLRSTAVRTSVEAWRDRVRAVVAAGRAPAAVRKAADEIQDIYFSKGDLTDLDFNSPFWFAPPIWLQQNVKVCGAGGTVTPSNGTDLVDNGYMPDLYIYVDGQLVSKGGGQQIDGPAQTGDFKNFSNPGGVPYVGEGDPWHECFHGQPGDPRFINRRDGQPWDLDWNTSEDQTPTAVRLCHEDKDVRHDELG